MLQKKYNNDVVILVALIWKFDIFYKKNFLKYFFVFYLRVPINVA